MFRHRLPHHLIALASLQTLAGCQATRALQPAEAVEQVKVEKLVSPDLTCRLHDPKYRKLELEVSSDERLIGAWETVIPKDDGAAMGNILGMQTVHSIMLPSGKILLVSGSSWRNLASKENHIQYYPEYSNPAPPSGSFANNTDPFENSKLENYYQLVNHAAVYDPENNTFYRIPHPVPVKDPDKPDHFAPNDLFCTGQQHLPDGNVLFTGGTQYYSPFRTGNRSTFIFDWRKELGITWTGVDWRQLPDAKTDPWTFAGFMARGRWYPSLIPLLDGRLALFSGYTDLDDSAPADQKMYQFEINHLVEFFDPSRFDPARPQEAWRAVDVKKLENSPFTVEINPNFVPTEGVDSCKERCIKDNQFDAFKLYPVNYLMKDGRIFITGEGDWVSLRTCDTAFMRRTRHTYWATIAGTRERPTMSFSKGPERAQDVTSYGTSLVDPNNGDIHILGGQPASPGTFLPIDSLVPNQFAGGRGSRKRETFHPSSAALGGEWLPIEENFLGEHPQDDRTMHYSVVLPTRQILIINGGNYDFYGPVHYPLLLTPRFREGKGAGEPRKVLAGYDRQRMADAVEPRLYHNVAMLLPDGRVFVSGGNAARATVHLTNKLSPKPVGQQPKPNLDVVENDVYFWDDGPMAKGRKGMRVTPTENWTGEIFSPPYMFIDKDRPRTRIKAIESVSAVDYTLSKVIGGKTYVLLHGKREYDVQLAEPPVACSDGQASLSLIKLPSATHGWDGGQKFVDLPFTQLQGRSDRLRFQMPDAKLANIPPGYYMMFYVDCHGKPSIAQMVRFDDNAREP